ncbi:phage head closure protein [Paracoccus sp. AK26]|uniref:phage head closure protein n=1 Tax=Paracoccus sp. AK26 TaxID=2589076 RepID=UPI00142853BB|nr:phage head closure protein [Paracoccus sp. AK26]QIR85012.1 head-tail adaptor protein [Paracoccus sp. AK26]
MKTARLRDRITIQEPIQLKDANGKIVQRYDTRGTVWADIQHRPGSEPFQQARMEAKDPATIAVRASKLTQRMTSEWRVETADRVFEIKGNPWMTDDRAFVVFQAEGRRK